MKARRIRIHLRRRFQRNPRQFTATRPHCAPKFLSLSLSLSLCLICIISAGGKGEAALNSGSTLRNARRDDTLRTGRKIVALPERVNLAPLCLVAPSRPPTPSARCVGLFSISGAFRWIRFRRGGCRAHFPCVFGRARPSSNR